MIKVALGMADITRRVEQASRTATPQRLEQFAARMGQRAQRAGNVGYDLQHGYAALPNGAVGGQRVAPNLAGASHQYNMEDKFRTARGQAANAADVKRQGGVHWAGGTAPSASPTPEAVPFRAPPNAVTYKPSSALQGTLRR